MQRETAHSHPSAKMKSYGNVEIANELLLQGLVEGVTIVTGLKNVKQFFEDRNDPEALKEKDKER